MQQPAASSTRLSTPTTGIKRFSDMQENDSRVASPVANDFLFQHTYIAILRIAIPVLHHREVLLENDEIRRFHDWARFEGRTFHIISCAIFATSWTFHSRRWVVSQDCALGFPPCFMYVAPLCTHAGANPEDCRPSQGSLVRDRRNHHHPS
jgi:hypothetical protein